MKTFRFILAACGFSLIFSLSVSAAADKDKEDPVRTLKPVENSQARLGDQIQKTSDGMKDLLEEISENIGVDIQAREPVKTATGTLDNIADKSVPKVIDPIRKVRSGEVHSVDGLGS